MQLALPGQKTCFDLSEALSIGELCGRHTKVLIETAEILYLAASAIFLDITFRCVYRRIHHCLRRGKSRANAEGMFQADDRNK
jgi:hypothetical protein